MSLKIGALCLLVGLGSCAKFGQMQGSSSESRSKDLSELSLNLNVVKKTLPNGMKIIIAENHKLPIFSIYSYFDVGGKFERKGTTGATHFLEHMMFKKTKNHKSGHFSKFIERNGGHTNAYTTFDNTVYYESLPIKTLENMLGLEAERLENLELDEKEFESERLVVLEERKMRYENSPRGLLYLSMMKAIFKGTPYGGSVIGDEKDVKSLTRDKMLDFYNKFYKPNNVTMVIVGDVNPTKVLSIIEEKFSKIKYDKNLDKLKAKLDHKNRYVSKVRLPLVKKVYGQSNTPLFSLSFKAPKVGMEDSYALDFLSAILGTGDSSYLKKKYVSNRSPKVTSIFAANYSMKNSGVFFIQGQLLEKVNLHKFKRSLLKTVQKSCKSAITKRNIEKTKNMILLDYYGNISSNSGLASFLGSNEFFYGDYENYKKELAIYDSMTVEKVIDVCNRYLNPKKSAFISVWKKHKRR